MEIRNMKFYIFLVVIAAVTKDVALVSDNSTDQSSPTEMATTTEQQLSFDLTSDVNINATDAPKPHYLFKVADDMYQVGMTLLFILGSVGNFLALAVLLIRMRQSPGSPYLIVLGFIDQYIIFAAVLGSHVIRTFTGFDYIRSSSSLCQYAYFSIVACAQTSFYLIAMMSIERAMVVSRPLRFMHTFTRKRVYTIIAIICIIWVGKNLNMFWVQGAVYLPNVNGTLVKVSECGLVRGPTYYFGTKVRPWLDYVITFSAAGIIIICNIIIIGFVVRSLKMQKKMANVKESESEKKAMQMIPMLVTTSLTFLILAMPLQIVTIIYPSNPNDVSSLAAGTAKFLWSFGLLTNYFNNGINFYLYCLSGRTFRQELIKMFCGDKPKEKHSTATTVTTVSNGNSEKA